MGFGDWLDKAGESISDGWDAATSAETYTNAYNSAKESVVSAAGTAMGGLSVAGNWIADTAAPAAAEGFAHVGSVILAPIALASEVTGIGNDTAVIRGISERAGNVGGAISGFASYAYNEPARAGAMVGQGITNGVTAIGGLVPLLGGLVVDAGRGAVNTVTYVATAPVRGVINLGLEDDQKIDNVLHIGSDKAFAVTVAGMGAGQDLHNWAQWRNINKDNQEWQAAFAPIQKKILINGELTENPYANYERTLLYGPQVVTEVGAFVVLSAATGGTVGAVMGAARFGRGAQATTAAARSGTTTATAEAAAASTRSGATATTTAAAESTGAEALAQVSDDIARGITNVSGDVKQVATANGTAANEAAVKSGEKIAQVQTQTSQATVNGQVATANGTAANEAAVKSGEKVVQMQTQTSQAAVNGQSTTAQLTAAEQQSLIASSENVIQINAKAAQTGAQQSSVTVEMQGAAAKTVNGPTVTVAESASSGAANTTGTAQITNVAPSVTTIETTAEAANQAVQVTRLQATLEGAQSGFAKGTDFANPFTQGKWGKGIEVGGVGLGFGLGWSADVKAAEQRAQATDGLVDNAFSGMMAEFQDDLTRAEEEWLTPDSQPQSKASNYRQDFQNIASGSANDGHVSAYASDGATQTNAFNNRANGAVIPSEGSTQFVLKADTDTIALIKASFQSN